MYQANIGDGSTNGAPIVPIDCPAGATIVIAVIASSPGSLTVKQYPDDPSPTTITAGNNASFTQGVLVSSPGSIASIQVTGGTY